MGFPGGHHQILLLHLHQVNCREKQRNYWKNLGFFSYDRKVFIDYFINVGVVVDWYRDTSNYREDSCYYSRRGSSIRVCGDLYVVC